jgi:hypothetical protein
MLDCVEPMVLDCLEPMELDCLDSMMLDCLEPILYQLPECRSGFLRSSDSSLKLIATFLCKIQIVVGFVPQRLYLFVEMSKRKEVEQSRTIH